MKSRRHRAINRTKGIYIVNLEIFTRKENKDMKKERRKDYKEYLLELNKKYKNKNFETAYENYKKRKYELYLEF